MELSELGLLPHTSKTMKPGDRFGRLTIFAIGKPPGSYRYQAVCRCGCGTFPYVARADGLARGTVVGCGCVQKERTTTHGLTGTPLLQVWTGMMRRCENPADDSYPRYGGRGITVCERWHAIENFVADMGSAYRHGLTLERINNDGPYTPKNCRWATATEQANNRRSNTALRYNGRTQNLREWADETGINYGTLWERVKIHGWSAERALTTPPLSASERMKIARSARWEE